MVLSQVPRPNPPTGLTIVRELILVLLILILSKYLMVRYYHEHFYLIPRFTSSQAGSQNSNTGNDPSLQVLQNSIEQLLSQANSFLTLRSTSVIEKGEIPASGDKHDFLSLAPYRWPNPDNPDGLPYVNYDGKLNPEVYSVPDKKNMDDMVYRVKILSLAYYFYRKSPVCF